MIVFNDFALNHRHGVLVLGPWDFERQVSTYPGLEGELHLTGKRYGRKLSIDYHFLGFESAALLYTALDIVDQQLLNTSGTLLITGNGSPGQPIQNCTFDGFQPAGPVRWDGSGVNGWHIRGQLVWTQRKANSSEQSEDEP